MAMNATKKLGMWSAMMTAMLAAAFMAIGFFGTAYTGTILYPFVISVINPIDYAVWIPGLLMAPSFVVLIACIHDQAPRDKKIFSQIGLSFAILYAGLITSDYFIQLTAVLPSIMSNETEGLSFFSMYNPHGLFIALESLGYLMMNAALLAVAAVFTGRNRLERSIRWLFVIGFILAIVSFALLTMTGYPIVVFEVAIISIDVAVLIASGFLLRRFFLRTEPSTTLPNDRT